jgi:ABC-type glutathione transport system ATPase component
MPICVNAALRQRTELPRLARFLDARCTEQRQSFMAADEAIVDTFGLTRRFGAFTAVDAVSLAVRPGEIFGLIGPNGAGKSTLVKMLTTMLPPGWGWILRCSWA